MKTYKYSVIECNLRKLYRIFFPVPKSPWTSGFVDDICSVNLVPPQKLVSFFKSCINVLQSIKGQDIGDYLEFGVFNGNSIGSMYIANNELGIKSTRFFGFDSFEGLPKNSEKDDGGVWKQGFYSCTQNQTKKCLVNRGINIDSINLIPGWYDKTLNSDLIEKLKITNIGIVFVDCDTYISTKTVLNFIAPLIKSPMIICFDDWKLNNLDIKQLGEYKAFNEFMESNPKIVAKEINLYNRKSKTFILKIK